MYIMVDSNGYMPYCRPYTRYNDGYTMVIHAIMVEIVICCKYSGIYITEGSLEVKLPTIWTVEKQR